MITTGGFLDRVATHFRDERRSKVWYPMQFLYMGFDQQASVRCFRFQAVLPKERPCNASKFIDLKLNADMSLWAPLKIAIQDGPKLCLGILTTALTGSEQNTLRFTAYAVTPEDLTAFASARKEIEEAKVVRRKPRPHFKPAASSQLKWPQYK